MRNRHYVGRHRKPIITPVKPVGILYASFVMAMIAAAMVSAIGVTWFTGVFAVVVGIPAAVVALVYIKATAALTRWKLQLHRSGEIAQHSRGIYTIHEYRRQQQALL